MAEKNLAIIAAAGYGRRMGKIDVPKVMLPRDNVGGPLIEDAFTFLDYRTQNLDFAVLSRQGNFFEPLNEYLRTHHRSGDFSVLHQHVNPKEFHVMALIMEYLRFGKIYHALQPYSNIIVLPADHRLTAEDLDLGDLVRDHHEKDAKVTGVYSKGWDTNLQRKDVLSLDDAGRIKSLLAVDPSAYEIKNGDIQVTGVGVWVISRKIFDNPTTLALAYLGFKLKIGAIARVAHAFPYLMRDGWNGLRDTRQDLNGELRS